MQERCKEKHMCPGIAFSVMRFESPRRIGESKCTIEPLLENALADNSQGVIYLYK